MEVKTKHTKSGPREYRYYRCAQYNVQGHPRVRVSEADLDGQVLALFDKMKVQDEMTRDLIAHALRERVKGHQQAERKRLRELLKQQELIQDQRDELVNLRLLGEINQSTFSRKQTECRDKEAEIILRLEGIAPHLIEVSPPEFPPALVTDLWTATTHTPVVLYPAH